ncbi:hypothetical protein Hanom_Chr11g01037201 [Helianthus anomalus]
MFFKNNWVIWLCFIHVCGDLYFHPFICYKTTCPLLLSSSFFTFVERKLVRDRGSATATFESIFNNRSLIYGKSEKVEVLFMPHPMVMEASRAIGTPDVAVIGDGDVAAVVSVQGKRLVMQKKAVVASVVAEDYARIFGSVDVDVAVFCVLR